MMTRLQLLEKAVHAASEIIINAHPSKLLTYKKNKRDYTTQADINSQKVITELISTYFPSDAILTEETTKTFSESKLLGATDLWIIDPLDGTADFQHERKHVSIAVAYAQKGILQEAIIYAPFLKDRYTASKAKGACRNGKKLHVSDITNLSEATVYTGNAYDPVKTSQHLRDLLKIQPSPWIQIKGSAALMLCEVAAGSADLFFSYVLKPWDNAAAFLILKEAGGVIKNKRGEDVSFFSNEVIAGNHLLVNEFIKVTSE